MLVTTLPRDQGEPGAAKVGGGSPATHDAAGLAGWARKDATTRWAHGELGDTKWPMPGMLTIVALDNLSAAAFAPASDVSVSKLPERRRVGMALATGWRMASGAAGTFQTSRQS